MTGKRRILITALYLLALAALGSLQTWYLTVLKTREQVTISRLTPDETVRASLVEVVPYFRFQREFLIRLEDLTSSTKTTLFQATEAGDPPGTERLIWSKDGTKLLVVGRHFYVREEHFLDNGDQAYFLHDRSTGRSWINADAPTTLPPLTAGLIQAIEFTEPVVLKPR